jgi:hypothetical protein
MTEYYERRFVMANEDMTKISVRISKEEKEILIEYGNDNDLTMS